MSITPFQQLFNYGSALVKHLLGGGRVVGEVIYEARATICRTCPSNIENVCQECGCNLEGDSAVLSKLLMPTERCPLNKWCSYDQFDNPVIKQSPELYQINMMLKSNGEHILSHMESVDNPMQGKVILNKDPLNNENYGTVTFSQPDLPESTANLTVSKQNSGCGCGGS